MTVDGVTRRERGHGNAPLRAGADRRARTIASRLANQRILVTRAAEDAERWAERLRQLGAQALVMPCLEIVPLGDTETARALSTAVGGASWLVLASRCGVEAVARIMARGFPSQLHVAVVGPAHPG
jgi:uroporphyrinogen-III synthase